MAKPLRVRLRELAQRRQGIPPWAAAPIPAGPASVPARKTSRARPGPLQLVQGALMSTAGGLPPARPDQTLDASPAGVSPGTAAGTFKGRQVIVFGSGNGAGIFVYNGQPGLGNPPVLSIVAPGVTQDPFGNGVAAVLEIGTMGGPGALFDQFGNLSMAGADGSLIELSPEANLPFTLGLALTGVMQTLMTMVTLDPNELQAGVVSGIVLGSGTSAKMSTLITSPYVNEGMGVLLQAQNDGATDTPWMTVGTVTTQGAALTFQPIFALGPQVFLEYTGTGGITVITHTTHGSGSDPIPAGVTSALFETWGAATGGHCGIVFPTTANGGEYGGAGGEYAADSAMPVTGGGTVAWTVGQGSAGTAPGQGTPGNGTASTLNNGQGTGGGAGNGITTANPGTITGNLPIGGTGSAAAVHHNGGNGGTNPHANTFPAGNWNGGASGGGSAGPTQAGRNGNNTTSNVGAVAPAAVSGGGQAGSGGSSGVNGQAGGGPGAGGGGGWANASSATSGGNGHDGQTRLTYSAGGPGILVSFAAAAGTDQFGTAYNAGPYFVPEGRLNAALAVATTASFGPITGTGQNNLATVVIPANELTAGTAVELHVFGTGSTNATQTLLVFSAAIGSNQMGTAQGPAAAAFPAAATTFSWHAVARLICRTAGSSGTAIGGVSGSVTVVPGPNVIPGTPADYTIPFDAWAGSAVAVNTTIANTFAIRAGWGAAGNGSITNQASYSRRGP